MANYIQYDYIYDFFILLSKIGKGGIKIDPLIFVRGMGALFLVSENKSAK